MIGFIGGSGVYDLEGLESVGEKKVERLERENEEEEEDHT